MTREEMLERARLVQAGKSRSWVQDAQVFAEWVLKALEPERLAMQAEIDKLHERCADLLEKTIELNEQNVELRREIPTEPDMRHVRKKT